MALLAVQCYKVSPWPMATVMFALRLRPEVCLLTRAYFAGTGQKLWPNIAPKLRALVKFFTQLVMDDD